MAKEEQPFADLPVTPGSHFALHFYAAIWQLIAYAAIAAGSRESLFEPFPFLAGYWGELMRRAPEQLSGTTATTWWRDAIGAWEAQSTNHLPLQALREAAGLDLTAMFMLVGSGLAEEDARFGQLFESLHGMPGQHRPTAGLLARWWSGDDDPEQTRATLRRLQRLALLRILNPDAPRSEWASLPPAPVWDALRGESPAGIDGWAAYHPPEDLAGIDDLVLPQALMETVRAVPGLLATGSAQTVVLRGPQHNGRRTVLGAVARAVGRGTLEVRWQRTGPAEQQLIGPLATLLNALPVLVMELGPSEMAELPRPAAYSGPLGVVLGRQGGVTGAGAEQAINLASPVPGPEERRALWQRSVGTGAAVGEISQRFRMTSGNIQRAAGVAPAYAALDGRTAVTAADVRRAQRSLNRHALDTLAAYVPAEGDWDRLAVSDDTLQELLAVARRCRYRELLRQTVGEALSGQLTPGVRVLFSGPSGAGKTLAARLLASVLQMDLYRLDLSSVVNKYIGETEKNLNQVFAQAEELDVMLLLDEGDALLTRRTSVQSSNDRYANLETNYLLQRLEEFEGILIVTTNASQSIDSAFQRRMDAVVTFHPPDAAERWAIWQLHLPLEHAIDPALLEEVARRCALNGGQIRNAVLHAALQALDDYGIITSSHLEEAVRQEYRKLGAVCPLRHSVMV